VEQHRFGFQHPPLHYSLAMTGTANGCCVQGCVSVEVVGFIARTGLLLHEPIKDGAATSHHKGTDRLSIAPPEVSLRPTAKDTHLVVFLMEWILCLRKGRTLLALKFTLFCNGDFQHGSPSSCELLYGNHNWQFDRLFD
jgi:hypothetical protein